MFREIMTVSARSGLGVLILAAAMLAGVAPAGAQSAESEPPPARGTFKVEPLPPRARSFGLPDVPQSVVDRTSVQSPWFTLKFGLVTLVDYTGFSQDAASIDQVGTQDSRWDARSLRLMLRGTVGSSYTVRYLVAGEYKGFESDPENLWNITDVSMTFTLGGPATTLTVGKTKETFAYEMVGDAANLAQQERVLSPFFVSRNIGAKLLHVVGKTQRMTVSAGIFNDWWVTTTSRADSGTDVSARVTGLAWDQPERQRFLHLGLSGRYAGADMNALRYKGRPESNVADNYVDTGNIASDHAWHLGLEGLWNSGPVSVLAEYNHAWVASPASGNPGFSGYYLTGSWVLTGETRPYDRTVGYARRVMPTGRWGAPELVVRFSHVDLTDSAVQGGTFDKTYVGINWWATRRWKLGAGWGRTWLDRFGKSGVTNSVLTRLQWIY